MFILLYSSVLQVLSKVLVKDSHNVEMLFKTLYINIFIIK